MLSPREINDALLQLRKDSDKIQVLAGPRPIKDATRVIEYVVHALLDNKKIQFYYKNYHSAKSR